MAYMQWVALFAEEGYWHAIRTLSNWGKVGIGLRKFGFLVY